MESKEHSTPESPNTSAGLDTLGGRWFASGISSTSMRSQILPTPDQLPIAHQWRPPDHPRFKANFDGAVFSNIDAAGIGVVIRDSNAEVIGALSRHIPLPQTVEEVEALACRQAAQLVREIGISEVVFEGDSAIIV